MTKDAPTEQANVDDRETPRRAAPALERRPPASAVIELPALAIAAGRTSRAGQRRWKSATALQLGALVVAGGLGALGTAADGQVDPAALGSVGCFAVATLVTLYLLQTRPDRAWHDGRAVAESVKTLAWRYAVGGLPFGRDGRDRETDEAFTERLRDVLQSVSRVPAAARDGHQITDAMRALRASALPERREAYRRGRIEDQLAWYSRRTGIHESMATWWRLGVLGIETAGLAGGLAAAAGLIEFDVLGLCATLAAAVGAWLEAGQHESLARAYSIAAHELAAIRDLVPWQETEDEWARFVGSAEEAVSREHTMWRASRTPDRSER